MQFSQLGLSDAILRAAASEGYSTATPIQAKAIPLVIEGKDVLGSAQTGTGKTAAFAMPILHRLASKPASGRKARCLVLAPTRELASQIADSFRTYGKNVPLKYSIIFGGVNQNPQVDALRRGVDVIIATPGRLLDLYQQRHVDLSGIEILVLDEADRMLDMGFINDIRKIVAQLPKERQTLFFSATMPDEIRKLSNTILRNPVTVAVAPVSSTAERVQQHVYFIDKNSKPALLAHLVNELPIFRAIVFTRTKHGADRVVRQLNQHGINAEAIHGNKSQNARQRALSRFAAGKMPVLIATDIASRGIDIDDISHVVNFDLTHEPETYVHRIGRTARAGASGVAISFCDKDERSNLRQIERLTKVALTVKEVPEGFTTQVPPRAPQGPSGRAQAEQSGSDRPQRDNAPRDRGQKDNAPRGDRSSSRRPQHASRAPGVRDARNTRDARPASVSHESSSHESRAHAAKSHTARPHGANSFDSKSHGAKSHAAESRPHGGERSERAERSHAPRAAHPLAAKAPVKAPGKSFVKSFAKNKAPGKPPFNKFNRPPRPSAGR
jgi:ATP-dependent RNA helicase RhlE